MTDKAKKASWNLDGSMAEYKHPDGVVRFDMVDMFPDFMDREEIEQQALFFGISRKVVNTTAGIGKGATIEHRRQLMIDEYTRLCIDRKWDTGKRAGVKLITEAEFMEKAQEQGVPEEMAKTMWNLARTAQK